MVYVPLTRRLCSRVSRASGSRTKANGNTSPAMIRYRYAIKKLIFSHLKAFMKRAICYHPGGRARRFSREPSHCEQPTVPARLGLLPETAWRTEPSPRRESWQAAGARLSVRDTRGAWLARRTSGEAYVRLPAHSSSAEPIRRDLPRHRAIRTALVDHQLIDAAGGRGAWSLRRTRGNLDSGLRSGARRGARGRHSAISRSRRATKPGPLVGPCRA